LIFLKEKSEATGKVNENLVSSVATTQDAKATASLLTQVLAANNTALNLNEDFNKGSPCGDNNRCSGNGNCKDNSNCVCRSGYSGTLCQFKTESLNQIRQLTDKVINHIIKSN
jgi:hypothetical protein